MPRDIPIGNGSLLITFDEDYCLRDIYYPHVGKENHSDGHKFRMGVWAEGKLWWIDKSWDLRLDYAPDTLSTQVTAGNQSLGVFLECNDLVDYRENIYLKKVLIKNSADREREFRLFFHQDSYILESPSGDTAYYDPDEKAIIHYKGNRYWLISGIRGGQHGLDQYATGVKEFHGLEGTFRDAEDGLLQGNPIAQGSVDSTLSFWVTIGPHEEQLIYYWIVAGRDYAEVSQLNKMVLGHGPEHFVGRTRNYWQAWLNTRERDFADLPMEVIDLFNKSLLILSTNLDSGGAIVAANDTDIQHFARDSYSYMWPRDGAFAAYALDMAGYLGPTRTFFDFCLDIVNEGKESMGFFLHKYHPDGCLGSSWQPWQTDGQKRLPIQEDGTGLVLWALWFHFNRFREIEFAAHQYEHLVIRCGDFLASYRDNDTGLPLPSYDLWEEKWGVHTFTVSAVFAGLKAAENFSRFFGNIKRERIYGRAAAEVKAAMEEHLFHKEQDRFLKSVLPRQDGSWEIDATVDASIYAPFYFGLFPPDDRRVVSTMQAIQDRLQVKTAVGGYARYEGDGYFRASEDLAQVPGNPWLICTLWLAQWHIAKARTRAELAEALPFLEWVSRRARPSGVLAEQVHPHTGQPLSVSPLTWSHAAYITTVLEYIDKFNGQEVCPTCGRSLILNRENTPSAERNRVHDHKGEAD